MAPPRVLHVAQPTVGGVASYVRQLAAACRDAGLATAIACPDEGELPGWARAHGIDWVELRLQRSPTISDTTRVRELRRLMAGADVVHLHSAKAGAVGRLAAATMRRPPVVIFTTHGWGWHVGGLLEPVYRRFERVAAPHADVTVAVSDENAAEGREILGRRAANLRVITNGVDVDRFRPEGPAAPRPDGPLVTCVGRLTEAKGQADLIRAFAELDDTDARLRLVGEGDAESELRALAGSIGVDDLIEWAGSSTSPEREYRAADVVVVPSRWDGLSLVLLEAMASGAAIVATTVPGSAAARGAAVLVPPGDPQALAAGIRSLLDDPGGREMLGRAARSRAVSAFTVSRTTGTTLELYRSLLASHPGRQ
jgi:glycosyltransferase involved in cell wall biosynthesis